MKSTNETCNLANVEDVLRHDHAVRLAGVDVDGVLRGKMMNKTKFLSLAKSARESQSTSLSFGMCSVIFGWDMHDQTYYRELKISNKDNGYRDVIAKVDLSSFRRISWDNVKETPFFLVDFWDPDTGHSLSACPRSLLSRVKQKLRSKNVDAMAGGQ